MSGKRPAANELNHENWDRDEKPEERGTFRVATENEIKNRIIKRVSRKMPINTDTTTGSSNLHKKVNFGGFTGFAKQKTSVTEPTKSAANPFSFLAKLSTITTTATLTTSSNANIFSFTGSSVQSSGPFPGALKTFTGTSAVSSTSSNTASGSLVGASKNAGGATGIATSTHLQTASSDGTTSAPKSIFSFNTTTAKPVETSLTKNFSPGSNNTKTTKTVRNVGQSSTSNSSKSVLPLDTTKHLPLASTSGVTTEKENLNNKQNMENTQSVDKTDGNVCQANSNKEVYFKKLTDLNVAVSAWIKMHVDKNPLCILTPIFKDYERHLRKILEEKCENIGKNVQPNEKAVSTISSQTELSKSTEINSSILNTPVPKTNGFKAAPATSTNIVSTDNKTINAAFTFASKTLNSSNVTGTTASTKPFTFSTNNTPLSFGNIKPPTSETNNNNDSVNNDDDEECKVEFKKVVEKNAIYSKVCKVFIKKDSEFVEKGVGTLYLKPIQNNEKTQLLVRADTNLGNILVNLILTKTLPVKRAGKNNVLMICVPTPSVVKPTPLLLRVKSSNDADELFQKIEQYKK